ncbi:uncharacterized protein LOC121289159 [Carcharodon carcharias]|uniref:uncharacterized protein LOC121289159 n=1 Tax=Carcharodon carcharias TaxID=13397 RepID=UPI001B7E8777|nr:uncharacterized protein LOC121289159 [Carcharodon carcharias]
MSLHQLKKVANFRQLHSNEGPVKIYRSAFPGDATEEDVQYLRDVLGIQMIISLCFPAEEGSPTEKKPLDVAYKRVLVTEEEIEDMKSKGTTGEMLSKDMPYVHCNMRLPSTKYFAQLQGTLKKAQIDGLSQFEQLAYLMENVGYPRGMVQMYIDLCETSQIQFFTASKLLSEPKNVPALIHCVGGKDRTGIISAFIQTCVGLPREKVLIDYETFKPSMGMSQIYQNYVMPEEFLSSSKETMETLLEYMDKKYGSVQEYLTYIGFGPEDQEKMKKNILINTTQQESI